MDGPEKVAWWATWPDPYAQCPKRHKNFVKVHAKATRKSCYRKVTKDLGSIFHRAKKSVDVCIQADFELPCPGGKVMYRMIKGSHFAGNEFSCPAGFKSNLPGDPENDSRCKCY